MRISAATDRLDMRFNAQCVHFLERTYARHMHETQLARPAARPREAEREREREMVE